MSTALTTRPRRRGAQAVVALVARCRRVTRRDLQLVLGVLWLLDGVLQAQPFMFTRGFAEQVVGHTGEGQPGVVSDPVHIAAMIIAAQPFWWNLFFATVQLLLGVGLLARRTARVAVIASIGWAFGLWYLGEGLSGLASGHASLLTGAPGSAMLYAVIAAAAWPSGRGDRAPAPWLVWGWAFLWVGSAVLQLLPGQNTGQGLSSLLSTSAGQAPHWLARLDLSAAIWANHHGTLAVYGLVAVEFLVGIGALTRKGRVWALVIGFLLIIAIWAVGQGFGLLFSGQATDPNSGPLVALMAIALLAPASRIRRRTTTCPPSLLRPTSR
ncbi:MULTISPECIES: hypothetical protein [Kribbella]|nr:MULTISPECIES: hypothetical protein [Kribbella]